MLGLVGPLVAVAATALAGACGPQVPTDKPIDSKTDPKPAASSLSALETDLLTLTSDGFEGRGAGTAGGRRATAYLADRLTQAGLTPFDTDFRQSFSFESRGTQLEGINLVAAAPNPDLDRPTHSALDCAHSLVVLTAHYDHLGTIDGEVFNGADDNASGVAVALHVAERAIGTGRPFHLVLALLDAEEVGLRGARALIERWPASVEERIEANLNLDMVGRSDGGVLWVAGAHHTAWLDPIVADLEGAAAIDVRGGRDHPGEPPDWTGSSDHAVFHRAGIPFLYFGVDDHPDYHRATDDVEKLDRRFMTATIDVIERALVRIGEHIVSKS